MFGCQLAEQLTLAFPLWVAGAALAGIAQPTMYNWFTGDVVVKALGLTMLGMGTTLTLDDFSAAVKMPRYGFSPHHHGAVPSSCIGPPPGDWIPRRDTCEVLRRMWGSGGS